MPNYAFLIKARLKSPRKSLFCWFDSKSDSRAEREIMNILEDNDIESGRGADHQLPVRTDFPVFNDLPEESALDDTWCDRYELPAGGKTWQKIIVAAPAPSAQIATAAPAAVKDTPAPQDETSAPPAKRHIVTVAAQDATFVQRVLGAWLYGPFTEIYTDQ